MEERGENPFKARTRAQLDENFPPFEEALGPPRPPPSPGTQGGAASSFNDSETNLSIAALSALFEHNRHIHRFGLDGIDDDNNFMDRALKV